MAAEDGSFKLTSEEAELLREIHEELSGAEGSTVGETPAGADQSDPPESLSEPSGPVTPYVGSRFLHELSMCADRDELANVVAVQRATMTTLECSSASLSRVNGTLESRAAEVDARLHVQLQRIARMAAAMQDIDCRVAALRKLAEHHRLRTLDRDAALGGGGVDETTSLRHRLFGRPTLNEADGSDSFASGFRSRLFGNPDEASHPEVGALGGTNGERAQVAALGAQAKLAERGERLESLGDKCNAMSNNADDFVAAARALREQQGNDVLGGLLGKIGL